MPAIEKFTPLRAAFINVFRSSEAQADIAAGALRDLFDMSPAGQLIWRATGKALDSAETRADFEKHYAFLLPAKKAEAPKVDATTLASATNGNLTALGKLARDVGADTARELVAAEKTKANYGTGDHASNPWSKAGWSLKGQGNCVKAMGTARAAQIAAAVGCFIGSTRPVQ